VVIYAASAAKHNKRICVWHQIASLSYC